MNIRRLIPAAGGAVIAVSLFAGYQAMRGEAPEGAARQATRATAATTTQEAPLVEVYKNPTCDCCTDWAEHLRENGFRAQVKEGADLAQVRAQHGVPRGAAACHTALVDGYVIEGHVPADVIAKLLAERPEIAGLAVPGMPAGVPGMPASGPNRDPYNILAFERDGSTHVYATR